MGRAVQPIDAWLKARAGKPRLRVMFGVLRMFGSGWFARCPVRGLLFSYVGPSGVTGDFTFAQPGKSLEQGWRAFCDEHLRSLGYDIRTLADPAGPVSGKADDSFPLTDSLGLSFFPHDPGAVAEQGYPASAGFP